MENARQNRRVDRLRLGVRQLAERDHATAAVVDTDMPRAVDMPRVGDLARQNFVSLPAWFGSAKACAVLRFKAKDFALVSDEGGVQRVASFEQLAAAPAERGIAACAAPFGPGVALATPADRALQLMDAHGSDHAGVISGGVVVGVLSRDALTAAVAEAVVRTRRACEKSSSAVVIGRLAA